MDLVEVLTGLIDEVAGALASSIFCIVESALAMDGKLRDEKSLVTLLTTSCVWGNLSHHLSNKPMETKNITFFLILPF